MIQATGLVKCFGDFTALSELTTQIQKGSIYGLVGSNGSGKSTFLRLIAGVYIPDGGTLQIDGQAVLRISRSNSGFFSWRTTSISCRRAV